MWTGPDEAPIMRTFGERIMQENAMAPDNALRKRGSHSLNREPLDQAHRFLHSTMTLQAATETLTK